MSVNKKKRDKSVKKIAFPKTCPSCGAEIIRKEGESAVKCSGGNSCPDQIKEGIKHFVSRKAFDIEGLGEKIIDQLLNSNTITNTSDLYSLDTDTLMNLERMGRKSSENLISSIEASKNISFARFIYAQGIKDVGLAENEKQLSESINITSETKKIIDTLVEKKEASDEKKKGLANLRNTQNQKLMNYRERTQESELKTESLKTSQHGLQTAIARLEVQITQLKSRSLELSAKENPQKSINDDQFIFMATLLALHRQLLQPYQCLYSLHNLQFTCRQFFNIG